MPIRYTLTTPVNSGGRATDSRLITQRDGSKKRTRPWLPADVLIAGRYVEGRPVGYDLLGSANQQVQLLSNRYALDDFQAIPEAECVIDADGNIHLSGIDPMRADAR